MLSIRTANRDELARVRDFYASLIDAMQGAEYQPGWKKDVYPTREFLAVSIERDELYLAERGGDIVACMVVNQEYNEGYRSISWSVEARDMELLVIHALGVHPACAGRGIAQEMVRKVIGLARERGIRTIRLDVLGGNVPAERVYTKMGFRHRGTLPMFYKDTGWTDFKLFEYIV